MDLEHYLGAGIGSFIKFQWGILKGLDSFRAKINLPMKHNFLLGFSHDSEHRFGVSLEHNFFVGGMDNEKFKEQMDEE